MTDIETLYKINDAVTAMAGERRIAFATEAIEDAVLDELTHAIAVRLAIEPASETAAPTAARGTAPGNVSVNNEMEGIFDHLALLVEFLGVRGDKDPEALQELTHLIAYRFGYPVPKPA